MTSILAPLNLITMFGGETRVIKCLADELEKVKAVRVEGNTITVNPAHMTLGRYYFAELKGEPYLYRKVSEHEVEIYGLADKP